MTNWMDHPKYVQPFYLEFMNGNIILISEAKRKVLWKAFTSCALELSDIEIIQMVNEGWRSEKVGVWTIALRKMNQFSDKILLRLLQYPNRTEHLCICLARLGGEQSYAGLLKYIEKCNDTVLENRCINEALQPEWAYAALNYLQPESKVLHDRQWFLFLEELPPVYKEFWKKRHNHVQSTFLLVMELFDIHL
ncbi:DUF6000 family protein [Acinetobacter sp. NIPH 1852]|uniref:DUF6000 family protein n=1 Tax=Acinetobacter sp. NIPH 1852 TaxID=2923428 RepID=UPI001F4B9EEE|nr:DUF6000 family protein [Acinetobacter sp. NIPH 1852]MCH7309661.1 DUF6000 family protein [Acinetobacter sp. NIPH 1852]